MIKAIKLYLLAFWALLSLTNEEDLADYLEKIGYTDLINKHCGREK